VTHHEQVLPYQNSNQPFFWTYDSRYLLVSDT